MASERVQPTVPMKPDLKERIDAIAERYRMPKTHVMRLMLRAGLTDVEENGLDGLADRADGANSDDEAIEVG